ncbi:NAD(P)-dependent oxidoreductase [Bradyrhizobium sp. dw_411]|uniref:NAD(P)-dependent oxidoreductase n=1 Tax=Bradyrhizobium sp. dw_411 TaxID=2720082 RepID=UPI001BCE83ED|nr:NAD(P)-dependent oxidoreductase [Bradyrhizobium sp. dw_411]
MSEAIAVVGLGIMGGAIANNLKLAGRSVRGFDIDPAARQRATENGIEVTDSIRSLATGSSIILTSLPSFGAARTVVGEIVDAVSPGCAIVELSTFSLAEKTLLRDEATKAGSILIDCPLSGTGAQAKTRDLVVYASGDDATVDRCKPVFGEFAKKFFHLGAFGNGTKLKFIANHLVAIHNVASAEAMVLAMKAGLDLNQVVEVVGAGAGSSRVFEMRAPLMARNEYEPPTMQVETWFKDMDVITAFARTLKAPTPLFDSTHAFYAAASSMGYGEVDTASVCAVLERMAGIVRPSSATSAKSSSKC